ncbi:Protein of unknown function (DUF1616) [Caldisphaera lagunensis DSM 15908]|uniref:DUF1616 domain-containing protein n=1 Tax=Caldisphaera lagunensis (strain DSM 15908 / JCM 11604 / ANMR 0165 / IC-154) TaxID=1056495 RepID=L0AB72_CALLD|nr:DUF1616 domain-containing protein [Caldisphaera lagunensis]AFZ70664.1 Protein of unknown function (DUF1616) [Caldisphaera lagunensis DSM 15908]
MGLREEDIIKIIEKNSKIKIIDIINNMKNNNIKDVDIARFIYKLIEDNKIKYTNYPRNFLSYFFSIRNSWVLISLLIISVSMISSIFIPDKYILVKGILVSPILFFYPGYGVVESIYPNKNDWGELERVAIYIAISLAIIPLIGLILNLLPQGLTVLSVSLSLYIFSLSMLILSSYRKFNYYLMKVL